MSELARFRADPTKIRISVAPVGYRWRAKVLERNTLHMVSRVRLEPTRALRAALSAAKRAGFDGIDLGLSWAYEHPQKKS